MIRSPLPSPAQTSRKPVSEEAPPRLSDDPAWAIRAGAGVACLFFAGFLGWAALAPLDAGAYAQGVIAVAGNRQAVQTREGGVVTAIRVVEGQQVLKGQVLVELSASELRASERGMTGEVLTLLAQRARLIAERDRLSGVVAPPEFAALPPEDRPLAEDALRLQRQQFQARRGSLQTQRGVLDQRVLQLDQQTRGAERQLEANREQQRLIEEELRGVQELAVRGYAPKTRVLALQRSAAALIGEDGNYRAQIARSGEAIGEARLQALSLEREMMEEVSGQLRDVQVRLDDLQPKVLAAREQLAQATVRATSSGKVVGLSLFTVGGVAAPGQTLMEIVPQDRRLVIQAKISPNDADDLRPGQKTQIRFTSLHERDLPLLNGALTELSADSFTDEKTGASFFRAEVAAPPQELDKISKLRGGRSGLQAGLPVEVLIPLRKRTALTYLVEPLSQTFWRTGREH
ncbi:HlyD family type I secretion periplasmic adaptor subunit [Caulobacter endophyticus]|uniref:HlyD family type I secretion periplasmic adaptor subunit n=1 Tax=Caulobacter endophyticus TaxID=2172652 RepID=UPI00240F2578|nr:HlyD family type I secretion periplasmic adaptor subunit [Caulobacter endophyticus]MDG2527253.1 HlyD family type I secretion periplasmic adaptor subunit [Caulobacter endophyticus]